MPQQIKALIAGFFILILSLFVGHAVADEDYFLLTLVLLLLPLGIAAILSPGYEFFLAVGVLCPFAFPIPFVFQCPFFGLILGFCCLKAAFSRGMEKSQATYQRAFNLLIMVFFGWVIIRYCMNPVLPGLAIGRGSSISGFRGYLNYGICFVLVIAFGLFIRTPKSVVKLIKWLGVISICFAALFIPLTFTKSMAVAKVMIRLGLSVGSFDNGWLRFVVLPGFGLIILILGLLPNLFPLHRVWRTVWLITGALAILIGGNRSSVGMAFMALLSITIVQRRLRTFIGAVAGIAICLLAFHYVGETAKFRSGFAFFRILAMASERVARDTDAGANVEWRQVRWELAMIDVRRNPWIGLGYGGLDAVFATSAEHYSEDSAEMAVALGTIHNGFIAAARAFGIPFALLFIYILASRMFVHFRQAMRQRDHNPVEADLQSFVLANLVCLPIGIYIGTDINSPEIWFFVALGFVVSKLRKTQVAEATPSQPEPNWRHSRTLLPAGPVRF